VHARHARRHGEDLLAAGGPKRHRGEPAGQFHLNEQTTWAVGYYTAYGQWTSTLGALATWGIVAGLDS
jgi:hypothetical protein